MSGKKTKMIRRTCRRMIRDDLEKAWSAMIACPWKARIILAWRLVRRLDMDGKRKGRQ